jgi:hypothetical protein
MPAIVYVHGTGVREPRYGIQLGQVRAGIATIRRDLEVRDCYWGGMLGSHLSLDGRSIPGLTSRSLGLNHEPDEIEILLWYVLYQDPLYELRLLSVDAGTVVDFIPGQESPAEQIAAQLTAFEPSTELQALATNCGLQHDLHDARQRLASTSLLGSAFNATEHTLDWPPLARALTALAIDQARTEGDYPPILDDAALRDALVMRLIRELGTSTRGMGMRIAGAMLDLALRAGAVDLIQRKRLAITDAFYPAPGDVLRYQARGNDIRAFIRKRIREAASYDNTVILLAHSLGGIACVDLLVLEDLPEVKLLITVGSQAPFLYEINALYSLQTGQKLPDHFPDWLNIYDQRDILSYVGGEIFGQGVEDVCVDNRQAFPYAHGAYWTNPATWQAIERKLP